MMIHTLNNFFFEFLHDKPKKELDKDNLIILEDIEEYNKVLPVKEKKIGEFQKFFLRAK